MSLLGIVVLMLIIFVFMFAPGYALLVGFLALTGLAIIALQQAHNSGGEKDE